MNTAELLEQANSYSEKLLPQVRELLQTMQAALDSENVADADLDLLDQNASQLFEEIKEGGAFANMLSQLKEHVAERRDYFRQKANDTNDSEWIEIADAMEDELVKLTAIERDWITQRERARQAFETIQRDREKIAAWIEVGLISRAVEGLRKALDDLTQMADALEAVATTTRTSLTREGN